MKPSRVLIVLALFLLALISVIYPLFLEVDNLSRLAKDIGILIH